MRIIKNNDTSVNDYCLRIKKVKFLWSYLADNHLIIIFRKSTNERNEKKMNVEEQTVSGTNEIIIQDALNASLFKIKLKMIEGTAAPDINDLIIYVDKTSRLDVSENRKQYVFNLSEKLKFYNETGDEFIQEFNVKNNDINLESYVNKKIGTNGEENCILENVEKIICDISDIELFEGINYIYTNYSNIEISAIYLKNTLINKMYLTSGIFNKSKDNKSLTKDDLYFKDAFTKNENKLNLEVDNANIECIISKNNKFSLDSNGNLVVNSISTNGSTGIINDESICNLIYPVGSIYLSINNTNPKVLFGGNWESISGYYLYAGTGGTTAGSNTSGTPSNNTSGSTTLSVSQIPSHTHTMSSSGAHKHQYQGYWTVPSQTSSYHAISRNKVNGDPLETPSSMVSDSGAHTHTLNNTGGGSGHTHTLSSHTHSVNPKRYELYMWKRTS